MEYRVSVFAHGDAPIAGVDKPVVVAAEQDTVGQGSWAAVGPVHDVMPGAPAWRMASAATGKHSRSFPGANHLADVTPAL
jgi:hypothetical protein